MRVIFEGSISTGFAITGIASDEASAKALVDKLRGLGRLAESVEVADPKSLSRRFSAFPGGDHFVSFGNGIGNGIELYGPFEDHDAACEFAERTSNRNVVWEVFGLGQKDDEIARPREAAN